ncbi:CD48 antigen isoform X2 [Bombina bombina]|uniref:CD48 antigen isoform X2 n=1 Tax=Bombina bombina TaxID=8345 RepID=UPI00235A621C|nr:CD48 antigen isoform X2 [Bombina bombina]
MKTSIFIFIFVSLDINLIYGKQDVLFQVNCLIGGNVTLSTNVQRPIYDVTWDFKGNEKIFNIARITLSEFKIVNPLFANQMEVFNNGTTVIIRELKMNDSGIFIASITLKDFQKIIINFNVTVYEPVPMPVIEKKLDGDSADWCNFTLNCSIPTNQTISLISWKYRQKAQEFQPYRNESSIQVSLKPDSLVPEYLCVVYNPAHQKTASLQPLEFCFTPENTRSRWMIIIILISLFILLLFLGFALVKRSRRKNFMEMADTAPNMDNLYMEDADRIRVTNDLKTTPTKNTQQDEVQYIEVETTPRFSNNQSTPNLENEAGDSQKERALTIYTMITK